MRTRALSHWLWDGVGFWESLPVRDAVHRGCNFGLEHRGELVAVWLPGVDPGPIAPELENEYGDPVAVSDCDYCGDDGYTDSDSEDENGAVVAVAHYCDHCVKGITDRAAASEWVVHDLPASVRAYLHIAEPDTCQGAA